MYFLIELILALSIVSILFTGFMEIYKQSRFEETRVLSKNKILNFETAIKESFNLITNHIRENCNDGYDSSTCQNTTPLPSISNNGDNIILTYTLNSSLANRAALSLQISSLYQKAGCNFNDDGSLITIGCKDINLISSVVPNTTLDLDVIPIFQFKYAFPSKDTNQKIWKELTISFADLYRVKYALNENLFNQIADGLKEYHLRRRVEEANNPCKSGGGLHSTDDVYIAWVMQGYTTNPNALCNTSTDTTCSCANITWDTVNQLYRTSQNILINNISNGGIKLVDFFGNKIDVFAIVDSTDTPINPPNPAPNYTSKPPYTGLIRLNNTFNCTTNKKSYCFKKFIYPN